MAKPYSIRTQPVPQCPLCLEPMVLRRPKPGDNWDPFWGCSDYPRCKGSLNIREDGKPDESRYRVDLDKLGDDDG